MLSFFRFLPLYKYYNKTIFTIKFYRYYAYRFLVFVAIIPFVACDSFKSSEKSKEEAAISTPKPIPEAPKPIYEYGFNLNNYIVVRDTTKRGDTFASILDNQGVVYPKILEIVKKSKGIINLRNINVNLPYTLFFSDNPKSELDAMVLQPELDQYFVIHLKDSIYVEHKRFEVKIKKRLVSGVITNSLWDNITEQDLDYELFNKLSEIYAWTLDFFRIFKNDQFKVLVEEKYIKDSIYLGIKSIKSAVFIHHNKPFYAFKFSDSSKINSYFNEKGENMRRRFLMAPVKFSRISSRYSRRRFHPVQKRWKAHRGTDYAASRGTPIIATANGVVTKSSYSYGNGKYVKIRHNSIYSTQYLHMSRRAVRKGQRVIQGQVIGYVGSTGLATGPHVCYRFWKNGVQVDPYKQKLPSSKPIPKSLIKDYRAFIEPQKAKLDSIHF